MNGVQVGSVASGFDRRRRARFIAGAWTCKIKNRIACPRTRNEVDMLILSWRCLQVWRMLRHMVYDNGDKLRLCHQFA